MDIGEVATKLRPEQVRALRKVADAGPEGHHTDVWFRERDPNPISLLIIHRTFPGLLTGFSKERDPTGHRVTLTELGRAVLAEAESR